MRTILVCSRCGKAWETCLEALRIFGVRRPMCSCGAELPIREEAITG